MPGSLVKDVCLWYGVSHSSDSSILGWVTAMVWLAAIGYHGWYAPGLHAQWLCLKYCWWMPTGNVPFLCHIPPGVGKACNIPSSNNYSLSKVCFTIIPCVIQYRYLHSWTLVLQLSMPSFSLLLDSAVSLYWWSLCVVPRHSEGRTRSRPRFHRWSCVTYCGACKLHSVTKCVHSMDLYTKCVHSMDLYTKCVHSMDLYTKCVHSMDLYTL